MTGERARWTKAYAPLQHLLPQAWVMERLPSGQALARPPTWLDSTSGVPVGILCDTLLHPPGRKAKVDCWHPAQCLVSHAAINGHAVCS